MIKYRHAFRAAALPVLAAATALLTLAPAQAATKRFGLVSFERIEVQGDMTIIVTPSSSLFAVADASTAALDTLVVEVQDRTLRVYQAAEGNYGPRARNLGPVTLRISAQNVQQVAMLGSGTLRIAGLRGADVRVDLQGSGRIEAGVVAGQSVIARTTGAGDIVLTGQAQTLTAITRGAGSIDASAMPTRAVNVRTAGSGSSRFAASQTAAINAAGSASVAVIGRPVCTVTNTGSGQVECGIAGRGALSTAGS